ncbi:MAG: hypothetical protein OEY28_14630, partial [Nitrospira sp.]|nr:hypothetical protein [Nitrospira sp.]
DRRLSKLMNERGLTRADAEFITSDRALADYFDAALELVADAKKVSAWITGAVAEALNEAKNGIDELPVTPAQLAGLIGLLDDGKLNNITAREVFRDMAESGEDAMAVARRLNKLIEKDDGAIEAIIAEVIAEYADKAVADYRAGKQQALGFLVGQCMRKLKGKADPKQLSPLLIKALDG